MKDHITQAELHELFDYKDGQLINRFQRIGSPKGKIIGTVHGSYLCVRLKHEFYRVHRLVYLYCRGELPDQLDHKDGDTLNNKIENLRPCTSTENQYNRKTNINSRSGVKGVSWHKGNKKWRARVRVNKRQINLGYFDDIKEAEQAAMKARRKNHGKFINDG